LKIFHYVLDETVKEPEEFVASARTNRILLGKRTGFAFYRDHLRDRKILIGVLEDNARANNYFDGPFDQLPDNFVKGDILRRIFLQLEPRLKGRIDRFGGSFDGSWRYMIAPYIGYDSEDDLATVHECASSQRNKATYYKCFVPNKDANQLNDLPPAPHKTNHARKHAAER
jgi:hypothetical protein